MEVLNSIIRFLENNQLGNIADVLRTEWLGPKRNERPWLRQAMRETGCLDNPESQEMLSKILKRLSRRPAAEKEIDRLTKLKIYKRLLEKQQQQQPSPPVREAPKQPSSIVEIAPEVPLMDDDELMNSDIRQEPSSIYQKSDASFGAMSLEDDEAIEEYDDDEDPGFIVYECKSSDLSEVSGELAQKHDFPNRAVAVKRPPDSKLLLAKDEEQQEQLGQNSLLPAWFRFPDSNDSYYPIFFNNVTYDCFKLKVIYDREKTGFEETKDFQIVINSVIAARYQVIEYLGSAAFSKAIQCLDLVTKEMVCLKIIENNKDYVDQSIDEIKLLLYVNANGDPEEKNFVKLIDYFYHKEHLFIVTELLRDNLYEYSKYNREHEEELYFTIGRLQKIAYQVLIALQYLHSLHLVHCDLKPENILIKSYSRCEVKVIDFGSTCFIHDHLGSYVQSRSYRAPEVIIGAKYDYKIDIWSLGCILAELYTGYVLFQNETVQGLLARIIGIIGPFPADMLQQGKLVSNFFTEDRILFQEVQEDTKKFDNRHLSEDMIALIRQHMKPTKKVQLLVPKRSSLRGRLHTDDAMFLDFLKCLLEVDKDRRPSATEALRHPWITECKYVDGIL